MHPMHWPVADTPWWAAGGFGAGVDEVGRGPLAGPVIAAAVVLDPARPVSGLADSKKLTPKRREALDAEIRGRALAFAVGRAEVHEIDRLNILQASFLAMRRAIEGLPLVPDYLLVDGNQAPGSCLPAVTVVGGDDRVPAISAASILAKVARDREMHELAQRFTGYDFASNKGYGTRSHLAALRRLGPCLIHRKSFAPVRDCQP